MTIAAVGREKQLPKQIRKTLWIRTSCAGIDVGVQLRAGRRAIGFPNLAAMILIDCGEIITIGADEAVLRIGIEEGRGVDVFDKRRRGYVALFEAVEI